MAEINAKDLTAKTSPASTDSMLLFGTTSNEGAKITVDNLADNILSRLTTKTFANQVGGSSAATILAQLATLNSNIMPKLVGTISGGGTISVRPNPSARHIWFTIGLAGSLITEHLTATNAAQSTTVLKTTVSGAGITAETTGGVVTFRNTTSTNASLYIVECYNSYDIVETPESTT